jgi:hypothetical protein
VTASSTCATTWGHKGKFGHEFLKFKFRPNGMLHYANNFNYKNNTMITTRNRVYAEC